MPAATPIIGISTIKKAGGVPQSGRTRKGACPFDKEKKGRELVKENPHPRRETWEQNRSK